MQTPPLDPDVADAAPTDSVLTVYDEEHIVTYLRLLDANAEGADWSEVAGIVLHIDPDREPERARKAFDSHLARAKWLSQAPRARSGSCTGSICRTIRATSAQSAPSASASSVHRIAWCAGGQNPSALRRC